jgi:hypothetical protein
MFSLADLFDFLRKQAFVLAIRFRRLRPGFLRRETPARATESIGSDFRQRKAPRRTARIERSAPGEKGRQLLFAVTFSETVADSRRLSYHEGSLSSFLRSLDWHSFLNRPRGPVQALPLDFPFRPRYFTEPGITTRIPTMTIRASSLTVLTGATGFTTVAASVAAHSCHSEASARFFSRIAPLRHQTTNL